MGVDQETTESALGVDGSLPIIPGMQATIDIHTGEKRVLYSRS